MFRKIADNVDFIDSNFRFSIIPFLDGCARGSGICSRYKLVIEERKIKRMVAIFPICRTLTSFYTHYNVSPLSHINRYIESSHQRLRPSLRPLGYLARMVASNYSRVHRQVPLSCSKCAIRSNRRCIPSNTL
jgi:hypothetical protein